MIARPARIAAALFVPIAALLSACASHPPTGPGDTRSSADVPDRSILVSDKHSSALAQGLRHALSQRGWHLVRYRGDLTHPGRHYRAMAQRAKYRLTLTDTPVSACRDGDPGYRYRIAVIQNDGGNVPVTLSGAACLSTIVQDFASALDRNGLARASRQDDLP
ncbi:hypothetical protein [Salinisphaera hydrothermalis]|uniref:Lipoprotein n=1 Tax=Salinisphaera hydrothermalis (strain C41B8) TaxID=1304275 RepID=A0A084IN11_SALHC|nr:hypothetical protein [Salinisphaera hydrothermalis]KEZ78095.1 hypothetical protein C41B8_05907 [Salinisphaera hydrothermalis C41B8]